MRLTKAKSELLKILQNEKLPLSANDLLKKIKVNKTTVYRQLYSLVNGGVVDEVDFADGIMRYEIKKDGHHHHLVCIKCKSIRDIEVKENFNVPKDFKLFKHHLEFFGLCARCQ